MISEETGKRSAVEAVGAAMRSAWDDAPIGRVYTELSDADRHLVADMASRLAHRSPLVRQVAQVGAADQDAAEEVYRVAFVRGYTLHLSDLRMLPEGERRPAETLVEVALNALDAIHRARGEREASQ